MTWSIRYDTSGNPKIYTTGNRTAALFGSDAKTNPFVGDTPITERRSLLCVSKTATLSLPPGLVTGASITPGGSNVATWSKRRAFAIPNILGSSLTSPAVANQKCKTAGQLIYGSTDFRMAEFHDDTGALPGFSYWLEAYSILQGLGAKPQDPTLVGSLESRYWVCINDQNAANPWSGPTVNNGFGTGCQ
jgi:hypothetical protein